jgi:hypothetical protein
VGARVLISSSSGFAKVAKHYAVMKLMNDGLSDVGKKGIPISVKYAAEGFNLIAEAKSKSGNIALADLFGSLQLETLPSLFVVLDFTGQCFS